MPVPIDRRGFLGIAAALSASASAQQTNTRAKTWEGIFVIMQTPFLENLEIDEDSLRREADFLARCRVHGVVWPAGAGETTSISYRERLKFSEAVVKAAAGRTTVLIGVHGVNKFEAMEYARHAEKIGADGLHALGPGDGSSDPDILEEYFTAIASVSHLPLSVQVSTPGMTPEFLMKLGEKLPTFRIAKLESSNPPHDVTKLVKEGKRHLLPSTGGGAMNLIAEMERNSAGTMAGAGLADIQAETMFLSLPADVFHTRAVASVSGLSGTGAGIGTLLSTYAIGRVTDRFSFQPIIIVASLLPCLATLLFVTMVRARKSPDPDRIVLDF